MEGNRMSYPHKTIEFVIFPAPSLMEVETSKIIEKLTLQRFQMEAIIDYSIHNDYPIKHIPKKKQLNHYTLNTKL